MRIYLGVVVSDIFRYILEKEISLAEAFDRIELEKFLPSMSKIMVTKIKMIKMDDLKETLRKAYHSSGSNANSGTIPWVDANKCLIKIFNLFS